MDRRQEVRLVKETSTKLYRHYFYKLFQVTKIFNNIDKQKFAQTAVTPILVYEDADLLKLQAV